MITTGKLLFLIPKVRHMVVQTCSRAGGKIVNTKHLRLKRVKGKAVPLHAMEALGGRGV
jgi:hypothetical protein